VENWCANMEESGKMWAVANHGTQVMKGTTHTHTHTPRYFLW